MGKKQISPVGKTGAIFYKTNARRTAAWSGIVSSILRKHSFLRDHAFGRAVSNQLPELLPLPIVPLAFSLKLALEAATTYLQKSDAAVSLSNVRGFRWLILEHGTLSFKVKLKPIEGSEPGTAARFQITFEEPAGSAGSLPLFQTEIRLAESFREVEPALTPLVSENPAAGKPETSIVFVCSMVIPSG